MKLTDIAKKPKLISVSIDDEETVEEFGEAVDFFMYDRQPISTFLKMATMKSEDIAAIMDVVKDIVLDEKGKTVINDDTAMPQQLLMKIINVAIADLGN